MGSTSTLPCGFVERLASRKIMRKEGRKNGVLAKKLPTDNPARCPRISTAKDMKGPVYLFVRT